jgi:hypothetical protein
MCSAGLQTGLLTRLFTCRKVEKCRDARVGAQCIAPQLAWAQTGKLLKQ